METLNYESLGFKCGIEIHAQLDGKKLFCSCQVETNKKTKPDIIVKRKLKAVAGAEGKKDIAAVYEESKNKTFIYEFYNDCNCLLELDEEPPNKLNENALKAALQISLLLKARPVQRIKINRKIIVDGSNVSGFQRTMLIAENGKIKTSKGIIKIPTIFLEEEAAKKISSNEKEVIYRLDRLGVPLVEISTSANIKDPEHAMETASVIGMMLRSVDLTKRGLGTIRQDVNVSIKTSPRIEIKGFQDLKSIPKIIEYEVKRLMNDPPKQPEVRKAEPNLSTSFLRPLPGEARFYPETDVKEITIDKRFISEIKIPELLAEKKLKLEKSYNIQPEIAEELVGNKINLENYVKKYPRVSPHLIANTIITMPKEIRARFHFEPKLKGSDFEFVFDNLNQGKIPKDAIINILIELAKNKKPDLGKYAPISDKELEKIVEKIIVENSGASFNAVMGIAVSKIKNKAEGKKIAEIIKKFL